MLFFVLNVNNDRLDATLIIIIFLAEYTGVGMGIVKVLTVLLLLSILLIDPVL